MDLRQLRHFQQVVRSGSFSAAGSVLNIAQPALSRQIRALEDELGVTLLFRTGRGVLPTAAGTLLLQESDRLTDAADQLYQRIRSLGASLVGEATVGISPTTGRSLSAALARRVQREYPRLRLKIAESFSGILLEWLLTGRVDAAILYHAPSEGSIRSEVVATEQLSLIGSALASPFPEGASVGIAQIQGLPLILPTQQHGLRKMLDQRAKAHGINLNPIFELDSLDATISLVRDDLGLTILPQSAVRSEQANGTLRSWQIGAPPLIRPLVVATAAQRAESIDVSDLAMLLKSTIHSYASEAGWDISGPKRAPADRV